MLEFSFQENCANLVKHGHLFIVNNARSSTFLLNMLCIQKGRIFFFCFLKSSKHSFIFFFFNADRVA